MTALADLRALLAAATPPPWTVDHDVRPTELSYVRVNGHLRAELDGRRLLNERADAELIVAAVNSLPHLIAVAEAALRVRAESQQAVGLDDPFGSQGPPMLVGADAYFDLADALGMTQEEARAALSVLDEQEPR